MAHFIDRSIREAAILTWALTFFFIAIIAAVFGFSGIASSSAGITRVLFYFFLMAFVLSLIIIFGLDRNPRARS
jgi:uncharacterized membrane protein YtjA (UPF0391 family)